MPLPDGRQRHVQDDRHGVRAIARGHGDSPRIGAHHAVDPTPGRHFGAGVGHAYADAAIGQRLCGRIAGRTKVGAVAHEHDADATGLGLLDGQAHCFDGHNRARRIVRIHQRQRRRLLHQIKGRSRVDVARPHAIDVSAHAAYPLALALEVAQLACHQGVGNDIGVVGPEVGGAQQFAGKLAQLVGRNVLQGDLHCFVVSTVFHLKDTPCFCSAYLPRRRGSRKSRVQSPRMLSESTVSMMATPGKTANHQ